MSNFWKTRIFTLIWGFGCSVFFTGHLMVAVPMFVTIVIGNTIIMHTFIND